MLINCAIIVSTHRIFSAEGHRVFSAEGSPPDAPTSGDQRHYAPRMLGAFFCSALRSAPETLRKIGVLPSENGRYKQAAGDLTLTMHRKCARDRHTHECRRPCCCGLGRF